MNDDNDKFCDVILLLDDYFYKLSFDQSMEYYVNKLQEIKGGKTIMNDKLKVCTECRKILEFEPELHRILDANS